jgi:hypothetical protein
MSKGCWCPTHCILIAHPEKNSYKNLYKQPWSVQLPYGIATSFIYMKFFCSFVVKYFKEIQLISLITCPVCHYTIPNINTGRHNWRCYYGSSNGKYIHTRTDRWRTQQRDSLSSTVSWAEPVLRCSFCKVWVDYLENANMFAEIVNLT